jgi:ABC-type uncharacterized transport system ATPase subunit
MVKVIKADRTAITLFTHTFTDINHYRKKIVHLNNINIILRGSMVYSPRTINQPENLCSLPNPKQYSNGP